jgi:hypothetical protein
MGKNAKRRRRDLLEQRALVRHRALLARAPKEGLAPAWVADPRVRAEVAARVATLLPKGRT